MAHSLPRGHLPRLGRRVPGPTRRAPGPPAACLGLACRLPGSARRADSARRVAHQPPALSAEGEWPEGGLGSIPGRVS